MNTDDKEPDDEIAGGAGAEHLRARVVWYYFVGGLTQQDIANKLGVTRLKVNKILGQARTDGSVRVDIRLPLSRCVMLEEKLKERYGLVDVRVVPALDNEADQQRVVGDAAGALLDSLLRDGQGLGVGWGKTLSAALRRVTPRRLSRSWVTTLMGGLTRGSGSSTFEVSTGFAQAISADCYYLAAPIYFPSVESREALLAHHGISEALRRGRLVDIALVSCGDMSPRSLLIMTQTVTENRDSLLDAGAVGDLLGVFLDRDGKPVDHPLNERVLALMPNELKTIPTSILTSGGLHKVDILRAILSAGYVKRFVTDEGCAEALTSSV